MIICAIKLFKKLPLTKITFDISCYKNTAILLVEINLICIVRFILIINAINVVINANNSTGFKK